MDDEQLIDSIQKVSMVLEALKTGRLKVRQEDGGWVQELLALKRGVTGLLDISNLKPETLSTARATALTLNFMDQQANEIEAKKILPIADVQCQLFRHFEALFSTLTGVASDAVNSQFEIKARVIEWAKAGTSSRFDDYNAQIGELEQFYRDNATDMFRAAKTLGGVKTVLGGQRSFGASALTSVRVSSLYCDTQLIPDPIWPFLAADLHLNAAPLQLAIALFHLLPLRPLVDARLSVPPIFVFPSFDQSLQNGDAYTQAGIASLAMKVVGSACKANVDSIDELFEYAAKHETEFLDAITNERLFIPPGVRPSEVGTASSAADIYLQELAGIRDQKLLREMVKLPRGVLVLNGIIERLGPQFHLLENAGELGAQPMLSQEVHWHYFERCAMAENRELINKKILSEESFSTLRALQDDSLTWLANVPIDGLVELRERMEHAELRDQLKKFTAELGDANSMEMEDVVREVRHGMAVLIQRQKMAVMEIEKKYSPKIWAAATGGAIGVAAGASMFFMPVLAIASGVDTPMAMAIGAAAGGGLNVAKETVGKIVERRMERKTMLGLLAIANSAKT